MQIILDWRAAWRFASVWVAVAAILWPLWPADARAWVLSFLRLDDAQMVGVAGVAFVVARLWRQPDLEVVKRGL